MHLNHWIAILQIAGISLMVWGWISRPRFGSVCNVPGPVPDRAITPFVLKFYGGIVLFTIGMAMLIFR